MRAPLCICIDRRVCEVDKSSRCALTPWNIVRLLYFAVISVAAKPNLEVESYQAINTNISVLFCASPCRNFPWLNLRAAILFAIIRFAPFNFVTRLHCSVVMPVFGCCVVSLQVFIVMRNTRHTDHISAAAVTVTETNLRLFRSIPSLRPSPFSATTTTATTTTKIIIIIIIIINV
jgi:hypothetical protein